jgi:hypothetical protein
MLMTKDEIREQMRTARAIGVTALSIADALGMSNSTIVGFIKGYRTLKITQEREDAWKQFWENEVYNAITFSRIDCDNCYFKSQCALRVKYKQPLVCEILGG